MSVPNVTMKKKCKLRHAVLWQYILDLNAFAKYRLLLAFLLTILSGFVEGLGLVMLIPLLALIGVGEFEALNGIALLVSDVFAKIMLPLNLMSILLIYIVIIAIRAGLKYWQTVLLTEIQIGFVDHVRVRFYKAIAHANWQFLLKNKNSDLTHLLTSDIGRIASGTSYILNFIVGLILVGIHVFIAMQLSWEVTLLALLVGCGLLLLLLPQIRKAKILGETLTISSRNVYSTISDFLGGLKLAKSYSVENYYIDKFANAIDDLRYQNLEFNRSNSIVQMIFQIGAALAISSLFYIAFWKLQLPTGELLVLILIFARVLPRLSTLQSYYQQVVHMLPAYSSAMRIHRSCEAHAELLRPGSWVPKLTSAIEFNGVGFCYYSNNKIILNDLHCSIPAQQTTAIIGASGAGKSTFADLISGILVPVTGTIKIDGHILCTEDIVAWRRSVAYVPQETFLFHGTIRDNLQWMSVSKDENELWQALKLAVADQFVCNFPDGLDTLVGERGIRLSGGERQRIALARALLLKPKLLILDEATNALDDDNEACIHHSIDQLHGKLTIVFITHRLTTLRYADQIIKLEGGAHTTGF